MTKIYESPDRGATVYEREFGAPHASRVLIKGTDENKKPYTNGRESQETSEIEVARKVSKTWSMEQD